MAVRVVSKTEVTKYMQKNTGVRPPARIMQLRDWIVAERNLQKGAKHLVIVLDPSQAKELKVTGGASLQSAVRPLRRFLALHYGPEYLLVTRNTVEGPTIIITKAAAAQEQKRA